MIELYGVFYKLITILTNYYNCLCCQLPHKPLFIHFYKSGIKVVSAPSHIFPLENVNNYKYTYTALIFCNSGGQKNKKLHIIQSFQRSTLLIKRGTNSTDEDLSKASVYRFFGIKLSSTVCISKVETLLTILRVRLKQGVFLDNLSNLPSYCPKGQ